MKLIPLVILLASEAWFVVSLDGGSVFEPLIVFLGALVALIKIELEDRQNRESDRIKAKLLEDLSFNSKGLFSLFFLIAMLPAILVTFIQFAKDDVYKSFSTLVHTKNTELGDDIHNPYDEFVSQIEQTLMSRPLLEPLVKEHWGAEQDLSLVEVERLSYQVRNKIKVDVRPLEHGNIINVTYKDTDPDRAYKVNRDLVYGFFDILTENVERLRTDTSHFDQRRELFSRAVKEKEAQLVEFLKQRKTSDQAMVSDTLLARYQQEYQAAIKDMNDLELVLKSEAVRLQRMADRFSLKIQSPSSFPIRPQPRMQYNDALQFILYLCLIVYLIAHSVTCVSALKRVNDPALKKLFHQQLIEEGVVPNDQRDIYQKLHTDKPLDIRLHLNDDVLINKENELLDRESSESLSEPVKDKHWVTTTLRYATFLAERAKKWR